MCPYIYTCSSVVCDWLATYIRHHDCASWFVDVCFDVVHSASALRCLPPPLFHPRARGMSIDGAESEEDAHELSFYALR